MTIPFYKYEGTGNDFILIDHRIRFIKQKEALALGLCKRHFGIGSDGLILIEESEIADFRMDFLNPDGSRSFCGNGSRCAVAFFKTLRPGPEVVTFEASDGMHEGIVMDEMISVKMRNAPLPEKRNFGWFVNTGSPHAVIFETGIDTMDLQALAAPIRHSVDFAPGGTNVNLVERSVTSIKMRTFERGVESETLSCGTGVTAAALCAAEEMGFQSPISVMTLGGELRVDFRRTLNGFEDIFLRGVVRSVFKGEFKWQDS